MRQMYVLALGGPGRRRSVPVLLALLDDGDARVRSEAVRALAGHVLEPGVLERVRRLLAEDVWQVRLGAYETVARAPFDLAVPILVQAATKEEGQIALAVDELLASLTGVSHRASPKAWATWWKRNEAAVRAGTWKRPAPSPTRLPGDPTRATFFRVPLHSRNVLLAIDFSGSMDEPTSLGDARTEELRQELGQPRTRVGTARVEAVRALRGLPDGARFNVVAYNDEAKAFSHRKVKASRSSRRRAEKWILKQEATGLTNIWDALRVAFSDHLAAHAPRSAFEDLRDTIVFLTDGAPTRGRFQDGPSLGTLVQEWNAAAGTVVDCVGIGKDQDRELLRRLAHDAHGMYVDLAAGAQGAERWPRTVPEDERRPPVAGTLAAAKRALETGDRAARAQAAQTLADLGTYAAPAAPALARALADPFENVRTSAVFALSALGALAVDPVSRALTSKDVLAARGALTVLRNLRATATLAKAGPDGPVRKAAARALEAVDAR